MASAVKVENYTGIQSSEHYGQVSDTTYLRNEDDGSQILNSLGISMDGDILKIEIAQAEDWLPSIPREHPDRR